MGEYVWTKRQAIRFDRHSRPMPLQSPAYPGGSNPAGPWFVGECAGDPVDQRRVRIAMERAEDL
jgi:hypothetical protein